MTDLVLWSCFTALFAGALWFAWPRPPAWDPVVFLPAVLATLHRGELEAAGKQLPDWEARLAAVLPRGPRAPAGGWTIDPAELGPDYDPALLIGRACGWEALAAGDPAASEAVRRRLEGVRLAWHGNAGLTLPHLAGASFETAEELAALLHGPEERLVVATAGDGSALLRLLAASPGLRDRVRALLFVGARFDEAHVAGLSQASFDTEIDRTQPWFLLRPDDDPDAHLPEPATPPTGRRSFRVIDLGALGATTRDGPHLGTALAVLLAAAA
jgi:hypothetical protein